MALKSHKVFIPAPSRSSALWRYMSLAKFLSLLQEKALYLCNLELMARADPFEGTLPSSRFRHRQWKDMDDAPQDIKGRLAGFLPRGVTDLRVGFENLKDLAELRIRQAYAHRRSYFVNCWHLNDFESSAMWDIYSRRDEGIAIVSTEERLEAALALCPYNIFAGCVRYDDYSSDKFVMEEGNGFTPVLYKRISFAYENEYRLLYWDTSVTHKQIEARGGHFEWQGQTFPDFTGSGKTTVGREEDEIERMDPRPGQPISCDLNTLIGKVCVSPLSPPWFTNVVSSACQTYGLKAPVTRSELLASPLR